MPNCFKSASRGLEWRARGEASACTPCTRCEITRCAVQLSYHAHLRRRRRWGPARPPAHVRLAWWQTRSKPTRRSLKQHRQHAGLHKRQQGGRRPTRECVTRRPSLRPPGWMAGRRRLLQQHQCHSRAHPNRQWLLTQMRLASASLKRRRSGEPAGSNGAGGW